MVWLQQQGSVCPITGVSLHPDDLEFDADLQGEISSWNIRQTLSDQLRGELPRGCGGTGAGIGLDVGDDALYDF